jgi:hypothetical protein
MFINWKQKYFSSVYLQLLSNKSLYISDKMQEIVHLQSLLRDYQREKDLIKQNFENRQQALYRAIQASRDGDEAGNLLRELRRLDQEMDGEMQRICQKIDEIRIEINRKRV